MLKETIKEQLECNQMNFAWIMVYFYDQVLLGKYQDHEVIFPEVEFDESLCYEIHLFNQDKEIRCGKDMHFMVIKDPKDADLYVMKEELFILGNKGKIQDGFTTLTQYGRKVTLPLTLQVQNASHNARLVVHHLFDEKDGHLRGYRLVDIKGGE